MIDSMMPELSGEETVAILKELDPEIKVIMASGYRHEKSRDAKSAHLFLQKPFSFKELNEALEKTWLESEVELQIEEGLS